MGTYFAKSAKVFPKDFGPGEWFIGAIAVAVSCDCRTCYGQSSHPAVRSLGLVKYLNRVSLAALLGTGIIDRCTGVCIMRSAWAVRLSFPVCTG